MEPAAIIQQQRQSEFVCSACGADRGCDCNAPAVERLAKKIEQDRQRAKAYRERKASRDADVDIAEKSVPVAPTADGKARKKPTRKPVASGNDADAAAGGIDLDAYVAPPEEVRKNILNALEEHGEIARVFRKWVKLSHFDDAVRAEIDAAIDGVIQRWNRVRSTLRKRSPVFEPRPEEGNDVDPVAAAEDRKAAFAELETTVEAADVTPQTMMARDHGLDCGPMPDCLRRAP